jgi:polysaccharide biosynthesis/export protein
MFNPDGTHRADADIATDVTSAIGDLIKQGIIKPHDAPAKPITSFDDANKYLDNYPTVASESPKPTPAPPITVPPTPTPTTPLPTTPAPTTPASTASVPTAAGPATPVKPAPCPADRPWLCEAPPAPAKAAIASNSGPSKAANAPSKSSATKPSTSAGSKATATASKPPALADSPLYVLGPNDVVQVSVFDEPRVSAPYAIGPDGRMSVPLIGNFKAIDMTLPQLQELLTTKLRDEGGILEPVVNVQLLRNNSKQYTLVGGTGHTGPVPLLRETTIFDALVAAGFKDFANKKNIILRRGTKEFHFNYNQVVKGQHMEQNILIEDGDFIIVKE